MKSNFRKVVWVKKGIQLNVYTRVLTATWRDIPQISPGPLHAAFRFITQTHIEMPSRFSRKRNFLTVRLRPNAKAIFHLYRPHLVIKNGENLKFSKTQSS
jgi:hypothetical protein